MDTKSKWWVLAAGGIGVLALVGGTALVLAQPANAAASTAVQALMGETVSRGLAMRAAAGSILPAVLQDDTDDDTEVLTYDEALAAALGITVDDLQAAYETARAAALQQAVEEGLLTQEQADELLSHEHFGHSGRHGSVFGGIDMDALLADAMGISVEELEAAQAEAYTAVINAAVNAGEITQEEADVLLARHAISGYVEAAMLAAYQDAVQQALADGVITQEQADLLLSQPQCGMHGLHDGPGMLGGHSRSGGYRHLEGDGGSEQEDADTIAPLDGA